MFRGPHSPSADGLCGPRDGKGGEAAAAGLKLRPSSPPMKMEERGEKSRLARLADEGIMVEFDAEAALRRHLAIPQTRERRYFWRSTW